MMKNLRMAPPSHIAGMLLAAISALAYAPDAHGQDFQQQPLPSFYAGQPVGMQLGETLAAPRPPFMLVQDGNPHRRGPWGAENPNWRPSENTQSDDAGRQPTNYPDAPATADDARSMAARPGDSPPSNRVYDGLPVDGRPDSRPHGPLPPRQYPQPHQAAPPRPPLPPGARAPHEDNRSAVERMSHAGVLQDFLGLMKENYELKAQLKIQQIEFEAEQGMLIAKHEAEQQRHEAESRIDELESMNAELVQAQQHLKEQAEEQTREIRNAVQEMRRQLAEQSREMERVQQSKAELEHRARAFEAQLEQMKTNQKNQRPGAGRSKQVGEERSEKREGHHDKRHSAEPDKEHSAEPDKRHSAEPDKEHSAERDND